MSATSRSYELPESPFCMFDVILIAFSASSLRSSIDLFVESPFYCDGKVDMSIL